MTVAEQVATTPPRTAALPQGRRFLPCLPTLWPEMLLPRRRAAAPPFPFTAGRSHGYYFARNAIYHGARLLGLGGAEVLVPAYHHGVEVEALEAAGCRPEFVRVNARMELDLEDLEARVGPRTRAVYVIHYAGFPQPMREIAAIARRAGLPVIEDCALALFSAEGAVPLGVRGDLSVFCLYKTIPVPNGGLLVVNGEVAAEPPPTQAPPLASTLSHAGGALAANAAYRLGDAGQALRAAGRRAARLVRAAGVRHVPTGTMSFDEEMVDLGMSRLSARIAEGLDHREIVAARRRNYGLMLARLEGLAPSVHGELAPGVCPLFYPLLCEDKDRVKRRLAARGVETVDFWRSGHPACPLERFPEVAMLRRRVLELPLHQDLSPADVSYLCDAVEESLT
ncbi:MAG TPA: DegT/DnrJ/EryC1/StrS family aminotransferase [Anaeromyxobacteraceae bacterium]|jgi:dTDP-4-amino-4,6-dideoxygalactose transaminase|nr:DegT/DnrJ/EryC1/StrS family aminotransferase [Anaeromyxobacteraceae bacterium]